MQNPGIGAELAEEVLSLVQQTLQRYTHDASRLRVLYLLLAIADCVCKDAVGLTTEEEVSVLLMHPDVTASHGVMWYLNKIVKRNSVA